MRAERTVITFLALPSMVMENTTLTGGRAENYTRESIYTRAHAAT